MLIRGCMAVGTNESTCVSNKGLPYDEQDCATYGVPRGCNWTGTECACTNHGYYSKTGHKCWPPQAARDEASPDSSSATHAIFQKVLEWWSSSAQGIADEETERPQLSRAGTGRLSSIDNSQEADANSLKVVPQFT
mmetsp:Transcript_9991/g.14168  ORF Transcript_9991/g.14168 Transcript_9991/m.14168 type:complete len:136 (-) Transcript_9991:12-419(-)